MKTSEIWTLIIAAYAALISSLVLIWRLIEFYLERSGRIKIKVGWITKIEQYSYGLGEPKAFLNVKIINFSRNKRIIERPQIKIHPRFKNSNDKIFSYINPFDSTAFPFTIEHGETMSIEYPLGEVHNSFKNKGIRKIKILVRDSLNKKYTSKWFEL
jgi:hypothetical protein